MRNFTLPTVEEEQQNELNNIEVKEYENWRWMEDIVKLADEIEKTGEVKLS